MAWKKSSDRVSSHWFYWKYGFRKSLITSIWSHITCLSMMVPNIWWAIGNAMIEFENICSAFLRFTTQFEKATGNWIFEMLDASMLSSW